MFQNRRLIQNNMGYTRRCRKQTKKCLLAICLSVFITGLMLHHRNPMLTVDAVSFNLWRSINLDSYELLDRKNESTNRHGQPLELYYETTRDSSDLRYSFPGRRPSVIPNCSEIIRLGQHGQYAEMNKAQIVAFKEKQEYVLEKRLTELTCEQFTHTMGYVTDSLSEMERDFPIAYSMLVYTDFVQLEMLLRAIYRPQHVYCIHVDSKTHGTFHSKVRRLASCFQNVFLASRSIAVTWGGFSVLEPEVICLEDLWNTSVSWKYWINLSGQEYPLRTNYELVKVLHALNGSNNVEGLGGIGVVYRLLKSGFPPHQLFPVKGAVHAVISREFADFILHSNTSRDVLDWARNVNHPDEIFFNTLNYNPSLNAPGSYRGSSKTTATGNPFIARFKNWFDEWYCYGMQVRGICVFGVGDLPLLATREELFANKFRLDVAPEPLYCMEELIYNRTIEEHLGVLDFNVSYYETRDFVKNKF